MALHSAGVEYGIHCLLLLADEKGDSREPSTRIPVELQDVPPELLAKVFVHLAKADLTAAAEGVRGDFRLTQPANEISVLDVVRAIDGDRSILECREVREHYAIFEGSPPSWATHNTCSIHAVVLTAQKRMGEALIQQAILDLVRRMGRIAPSEFGEEVLRWVDASREGRNGPHDQPLAHTERRRKSVPRKTPLSTAVLVVPAFLPALSPEATVEWPPAHCNGP